ncbi:MAG: GGDEF domain-containing protein [Bacillota bacterium]
MKREAELLNRIRELEARLKEYERAKLAIEAAGFDIWENNFVTGETYGTNRYLFEYLGYDTDELPQNLESTFRYIHKDDLDQALKLVNAHFNGETLRYQAEMRMQAKDGSWVWIGSYGKVIERNAEGQVTRCIGLTFNIDKRRIMEEEIKKLAYKDPLTGLSNRRGLDEIGKTEVERAKRYKHPVSIMMLDIDRFKKINDTYGHLLGDEVLLKLTGVIYEIVRLTDYKFRWGGDEFIILLPETNQKDAAEMAERLRKHVEGTDFGECGKVTISIGLAGFNPTDELEDILQRVDEALYRAKDSGRNKVCKV